VLSDAFQAGIDWSRLPISGGLSITQALLGGFNAAATGAGAAAGNAMTIAYTNPTTNIGNISGTVKLLEEFGSSRVLSSPKLMAMNNQTALLKVVDNLVYFEIKADTTTTSTGPSQTTFNTTAKSVSVGVVMGVTPQINEDGRVLLNVRPTITRLNNSQPFADPGTRNGIGAPGRQRPDRNPRWTDAGQLQRGERADPRRRRAGRCRRSAALPQSGHEKKRIGDFPAAYRRAEPVSGQ
jgi:general secretion pathway protein D